MRRDHAQLERGAINLDTGGHIICCWDDCDKYGIELYKHISCRHDVAAGCAAEDARQFAACGNTAHLVYLFCSMRHRAYWVNATGFNAHESIARTGRAYGNLPVGMRKMIG